MTKNEIDQLPLLISRKTVRLITGLTNRRISQLVAARQIRVWRAPGAGPHTRVRFIKSDIVALAQGS